jgi:hypothetical protein
VPLCAGRDATASSFLDVALPHSNAALTFTDFLAIVTTTDIGQSLEQEDQESSGHHAGVMIQA